MIEKRYYALLGEDGYIYPVFFDRDNDDKEIDVDTVVDLLNENEQLKMVNPVRELITMLETSWDNNDYTEIQFHVTGHNVIHCRIEDITILNRYFFKINLGSRVFFRDINNLIMVSIK